MPSRWCLGLDTIEMAPGSIVTGTVVDIDDDWVVVHAGLKSEGVIPKNQFLNEEGVCTLTIGDQVKVAMEVVDDGRRLPLPLQPSLGHRWSVCKRLLR